MIRSTRELVILLAMALMIGGVILLFTHGRFADAKSQYDRRMAAYNATRTDAMKYLRQQSKQETVATDERPQQDLTARVTRTLREANLNSGSLTDLRSRGGGRVAGTDYTRQRYGATIEGVSMAEASRFLQLWSRDQQLWTPAQFRMTPDRRDRSKFRLELTLDSLYLAEAESER